MTAQITKELELEVEYNVTKGCRGHCDKYGAPEEPDTPDEMEITSVKVGKVEITSELTDDQLIAIESELWDEVDDDPGYD